ncbi:unnamed protein product, partial [Fusarium equiseti]
QYPRRAKARLRACEMPAGEGGVRSGDASEPRPGPRSIKQHGPEQGELILFGWMRAATVIQSVKPKKKRLTVATGESRQGHRGEKWKGRRGKRGDDVCLWLLFHPKSIVGQPLHTVVPALVMLIDPDHRRWKDRQEPNSLGLQLAVNQAWHWVPSILSFAGRGALGSVHTAPTTFCVSALPVCDRSQLDL